MPPAPPEAPQVEDSTDSFDCSNCGAALRVPKNERSVVCPFCASPSVVERPSEDTTDPTFVVGFVLDRERATERVRHWIQRRGFFAHSGLASAAVESTRGVYLPACLYGAIAHSDYQAEIGENYTVTETYTTTDSKGNVQVRTRVVTKTEWRDLYGSHSAYMIDLLVTASKGLPNDELEAVEPFELGAIRRYDPGFLAGWFAEEPSLSEDRCRQLAREESHATVGRMLSQFMPGDSYRGLRYDVALDEEFSHPVLLPIWIFALRYDPERPPIRLVINGQTGKVAGDVPLSKVKIALAVIAGVIFFGSVIAFFVYASQQGQF